MRIPGLAALRRLLWMAASSDLSPTTKRHPVLRRLGLPNVALSLILPGVAFGEGGVFGAGAAVRGDGEPNGLDVGVPARRIRGLPTGDEARR